MIRIEIARKRTEIAKDKENELRKEIFMQLVKDNIENITNNVNCLLRGLDNEIIKQSDLGKRKKKCAKYMTHTRRTRARKG